MSLGPPIRPPVREQEERWDQIGKTGVFKSSKTGKTQTWIPANEVANGTALPPIPDPDGEEGDDGVGAICLCAAVRFFIDGGTKPKPPEPTEPFTPDEEGY